MRALGLRLQGRVLAVQLSGSVSEVLSELWEGPGRPSKKKHGKLVRILAAIQVKDCNSQVRKACHAAREIYTVLDWRENH